MSVFSKHIVAFIYLMIFIPLGLIGVARHDPSNAAVALLWSGALATLGFFFGFLFALPRYARSEVRSGSNVVERRALDVNTNLLEIADWLTKIIVGLGLFELKQIPEQIRNFSAYIAQGLGPKSTQQFGTAVIAYFFVLSFFFGYLLTRLEINRLIRAADALYTRPFSEEQIPSLKSGPLPDIKEKDIQDPDEIS